MTQHDTAEQRPRPEDTEQRESTTIWGHSLAAASVCLGTGVVLALMAILGRPW